MQQKAKKHSYRYNCTTKFFVPDFYKYCRNIITTRYQQCHRQTKRSQEALAENGGTIKYTELLHIKLIF